MGKPVGKASAKAGANLSPNEHRGFRPLLEFTLSAILRYLYPFIITAIRSIEERFTHACTPKWRFACLREAASAKAGHAGMPVFATGGFNFLPGHSRGGNGSMLLRRMRQV